MTEEYKPKPCKFCNDPVYDDHREFEIGGKPACLSCYVYYGDLHEWRYPMAKNNFYNPKSLVEGYKIGKQFSGKMFVAVPEKKAQAGCIVCYDNKIMRLAGKSPAERLSFTDKYGRGTYWLYYYEWIPEKIW